MSNFIDRTVCVFGRLTVVSRAANTGGGVTWNCECSCGNKKSVRADALNGGGATSCGCWLKELGSKIHKTHGHHKNGKPSPTYKSWQSMKQRCDNPKSTGFEYYGGRGIKVCERWNKFNNFLEDMGERPEGLTLDRKDVDGNYELPNCKWASDAEQGANRRVCRAHN